MSTFPGIRNYLLNLIGNVLMALGFQVQAVWVWSHMVPVEVPVELPEIEEVEEEDYEYGFSSVNEVDLPGGVDERGCSNLLQAAISGEISPTFDQSLGQLQVAINNYLESKEKERLDDMVRAMSLNCYASTNPEPVTTETPGTYNFGGMKLLTYPPMEPFEADKLKQEFEQAQTWLAEECDKVVYGTEEAPIQLTKVKKMGKKPSLKKAVVKKSAKSKSKKAKAKGAKNAQL